MNKSGHGENVHTQNITVCLASYVSLDVFVSSQLPNDASRHVDWDNIYSCIGEDISSDSPYQIILLKQISPHLPLHGRTGDIVARVFLEIVLLKRSVSFDSVCGYIVVHINVYRV